MNHALKTFHSRMLLICSLAVAALFIVACQSAETKSATPVADTTAMKQVDTVKQYPLALVDNKKDPSCGMPVTAGIGDTAHYKDKVIGFCSAECKAEFTKNPDASIAAAELKK